MSISSISPVTSSYPPSGQASTPGVGTYLQQLNSALQSGNLSTAQQAFSALQSSLQSAQGSSAVPGGSSSPIQAMLQQGLSQIGNDLQSGNLAAAQTAFTNLQQQVQTAFQAQGGQAGQVSHHHHHHGGGGIQQAAAATDTTNTADTSDPTSTATIGATLNVTV